MNDTGTWVLGAWVQGNAPLQLLLSSCTFSLLLTTHSASCWCDAV